MGFFKKLFTRPEKTAFKDVDENETLNIVLSLFVTATLLLAPLPFYGLIAVLSWLVFLIVAIVRQYRYLTIAVIGVIFIGLASYQAVETPAFFEERRLYEDNYVLEPDRNMEPSTSHAIQVEIINDHVADVHYYFARTLGGVWEAYDRGEFHTLDVDEDGVGEIVLDVDHFENRDPQSGTYYVNFVVEFEDGEVKRFGQDGGPFAFRVP